MQTSTEKKMRNSATRNSIYEYLCGTKEHPSAEMIYLDLRKSNPNLSFGNTDTKGVREITHPLKFFDFLNRLNCKRPSR